MKRFAVVLVAVLSGFFVFPASAQERVVDRIPTPFVENGKPVTLEIVIFKPDGVGPFPTVMFNHGSTGRGDDPSLFTKTWVGEPLAEFFNARGWQVAFPQRRGRGKSDGTYDEGLEPDRSRYSCTPSYALPGIEHALQDLDAAVAYLKTRKDVDSKRMIIGGRSRGGILTIAYAGTRPTQFKAAINFVGGWMGERCADLEAINTATFRRGAAFPHPTLWLYGENDFYYSLRHSRKNFDAFIAAGGTGTFVGYTLDSGKNGHYVIREPELWREAVASFDGSGA